MSVESTPGGFGRRRFIGGAGAVTAVAVLPQLGGSTAAAAAPKGRPATIWGCSVDSLNFAVADQTVRVMLRVTLGASRIRIRISNAFGTQALTVGGVFAGRRAGGAAVVPGTNRAVTFSGRTSVTIPVGAHMLSDPVPVPVEPLQDLAVSVYTPGDVGGVTGHLRPKDFSYVSGPGDHGADESGAAFGTAVEHWFWVDAVVADEAHGAGTVAVLGDSITDSGSLPRGGYQGWVDFLARRSAALPGPRRLAFVNAGISGNRLVTERPQAGVNAQARLDRDVLSHAGVHTLVVLEGINDIYGSSVTAADLILAHSQIAARARARGLRVVAGTVLPSRRGAYTEEREAVRVAVNEFLRTSADFVGVIDFDRALRDPADPAALLAAYDSGDHTHPSTEGYRVMADAVDLALLYP